jgi:hypothetical protein
VQARGGRSRVVSPTRGELLADWADVPAGGKAPVIVGSHSGQEEGAEVGTNDGGDAEDIEAGARCVAATAAARATAEAMAGVGKRRTRDKDERIEQKQRECYVETNVLSELTQKVRCYGKALSILRCAAAASVRVPGARERSVMHS